MGFSTTNWNDINAVYLKHMKLILSALLAVAAMLISPHVAFAQQPPGTLVVPITPGASLVLQNGNTSQGLWNATNVLHGAIIQNPLTASQQGIATAESVFVNFASTTAGTNAGAQNIELVPGAILTFPFGTSLGAAWIATTVGHKISVVVY